MSEGVLASNMADEYGSSAEASLVGIITQDTCSGVEHIIGDAIVQLRDKTSVPSSAGEIERNISSDDSLYIWFVESSVFNAQAGVLAFLIYLEVGLACSSVIEIHRKLEYRVES